MMQSRALSPFSSLQKLLIPPDVLCLDSVTFRFLQGEGSSDKHLFTRPITYVQLQFKERDVHTCFINTQNTNNLAETLVITATKIESCRYNILHICFSKWNKQIFDLSIVALFNESWQKVCCGYCIIHRCHLSAMQKEWFIQEVATVNFHRVQSKLPPKGNQRVKERAGKERWSIQTWLLFLLPFLLLSITLPTQHPMCGDVVHSHLRVLGHLGLIRLLREALQVDSGGGEVVGEAHVLLQTAAARPAEAHHSTRNQALTGDLLHLQRVRLPLTHAGVIEV